MTTDARALDWDEVTARLAAAAESPAGRAICLALPFAADVAEARRRMAAVAELATLLRAGETLPSLAAPEIDAALASAEKTVALGAEELRPVAALARTAEAVRRYLLAPTPVRRSRRSRRWRASWIRRSGWRAPSTRRSTPRARFATRRRPSSSGCARSARGLQERARVAIEELMRVEEYVSVMQDQFFTIRAERYVLPLKASAKSLGPRHRARHVAHRRDRVRRADRAGRGQQPAQGDGAGDPARVAPHPRAADRRRGGGGAIRCAGPPRRWRRSTRARRRRGSGSRTTATRVEIVEAPLVDLRAARHPLLALSHPARRAWSPTTSRSAAASRRS